MNLKIKDCWLDADCQAVIKMHAQYFFSMLIAGITFVTFTAHFNPRWHGINWYAFVSLVCASSSLVTHSFQTWGQESKAEKTHKLLQSLMAYLVLIYGLMALINN